MNDELDDSAPSRGWEEYRDIVIRRRWWIVLPMFVCWAAVWGASWFLPTIYQSEAMILVEQQKVPDQYVTPNVTLNLQDRLQNITQQILSRTRLQATIDRLHLYPESHGVTALVKSEDPVDQMRNDIKIDLVETPGRQGEFSAFKIRYSAPSPQLAEEVNSELTDLFVDENARSQRELSENTTTFLESQLADASVKMQAQEAKVAAFKATHMGNLPGQLESNVQILVGLQAQLQNAQHALDSSKQQKTYLESLLQQYDSAQASFGGANGTESSPQALDIQLGVMRLHLQDLLSRYTEHYPDVEALKAQIATTEKLLAQENGETASSRTVGKAKSTADPAAMEGVQHGTPTGIMQIQSQLKANELEIRDYAQHEKFLESQIAAYQARLNTTPETEQELIGISRGYDESKANYDSLLQKQLQSQLATSLQKGQQGDEFRVMDPPSLPDKPSAPNRFMMSLDGLGLGVGLGIVLAAFLELTDVRVRQEKDLEKIVSVRILVGIPHFSGPDENEFSLMNHRMELGAASAMILVMVIGNLYSLYRG